MSHAAGLTTLGNVFYGCDLQRLASACAAGGAARFSSSGRSRCSCHFYFMADMLGQFRSVARELICHSILVGKSEVSVGATQATFDRHLTAGAGA